MAAPIKNRSKPNDPLYEKTREKIKVTQLVNRLNDNALGILTNPPGKTLAEGEELPIVEMTAGQIRCAEILLNKTLPSLTSTTIDAKVDATVSLENKPEEELDNRIKELTDK